MHFDPGAMVKRRAAASRDNSIREIIKLMKRYNITVEDISGFQENRLGGHNDYIDASVRQAHTRNPQAVRVRADQRKEQETAEKKTQSWKIGGNK